MSLGLPVQDLKEIASAHTSVARYLYEVLRHWITRIGGSWEKLAGALKSSQVDRIDVANKITRADLIGTLNSYIVTEVFMYANFMVNFRQWWYLFF